MHERDKRARLQSCLQTILDMEEAVMRLPSGKQLEKELKQIKEMAGRITEIPVSDADILRVEKATESFLEEIRDPLLDLGVSIFPPDRVH